MTPSPPPGPLGHISLAGVSVRVEYVRLLAGRLGGDEVAQKLERAVANGNAIVALSLEDRQRILNVLEEPPMALRELQTVLRSQLQRHTEQQRRKARMSYDRELFERRRANATGPRHRGDALDGDTSAG